MKIAKPGNQPKNYLCSVTPFLFFLIIQFSAISSIAEKISVIASIYPVADMVRQVGGGRRLPGPVADVITPLLQGHDDV